MTERTTLEIIAPTVEEALAQGLAQLGLPADAVSVEVLDSGNKGLFGLGGRQVRVRLTVNLPGDDDCQARSRSAEKVCSGCRTASARKEPRAPRSRPNPAPAANATRSGRGGRKRARPNDSRYRRESIMA